MAAMFDLSLPTLSRALALLSCDRSDLVAAVASGEMDITVAYNRRNGVTQPRTEELPLFAAQQPTLAESWSIVIGEGI